MAKSGGAAIGRERVGLIVFLSRLRHLNRQINVGVVDGLVNGTGGLFCDKITPSWVALKHIAAAIVNSIKSPLLETC